MNRLMKKTAAVTAAVLAAAALANEAEQELLRQAGNDTIPAETVAADRALLAEVLADTDAVQTLYRGGVPHTDRRGRVMTEYDPERSFFPIAIWGEPAPGAAYGYEYRYEELQEAGFNTVWPYGNVCVPSVEALEELGEKYDLQIVFSEPMAPEHIEAVKDHPRLLGNVWMDEPIGRLFQPEMDNLFERFLEYKKTANAIAPDMPVFINDAAWIIDPATSWFIRWNTAGDLACLDNYQVKVSSANTASVAAGDQGIPQSVMLVARANEEAKPVWLIVGAFEQNYGVRQAFPFRFPTPAQLRASVYAGLVHGATGIVYFIQDSYISRNGTVIGMSPDPRKHVVDDPALRGPGQLEATPMTPAQQAMSRALWETASQLNREMRQLTPALLSPTVAPEELAYSVAVDIVNGASESGSPVRTLLKPDPAAGGYVLLLVNLDAAAVEATFTFGRPLEKAEVLFDASAYVPELSDDGKSLVLGLEPFDAMPVRLTLKD